MHIDRITNIKFTGSKPEIDLVNAFSEYGITVKHMEKQIKYFDMGHSVWEETKNALERHGIPVEYRTEWYTDIHNYSVGDKIKETFQINGSVQCYNYVVNIKTYDLTKPQHKKEVRKLYHALRKDGYDVDHDCESTEFKNDKC